MKKTSKKIAPWAIIALCLTLGNGVRAADPATAQQTPANQGSSYETKSAEGVPARYNRASGIIGMDVRNQNDEKLGHIKDVVFDLQSQRVAYAVLSASGTGFMGVNEKLLAVPLNALTASPDDRYLILRADKSKIETAAGFDRENWPSINNPSWGAQPYLQPDTGTPSAPAENPSAPQTPEKGSEQLQQK